MLKDLSSNNLYLKYKQPLWVAFILVFSILTFFSTQFFSLYVMVILLSLFGVESSSIVDVINDNMPVRILISLVAGLASIYVILRFLKWRKIQPKKFLLLKNKLTPGNAIDVVLLYGIYFLVLIAVTVFLGVVTNININQAQDLGIAKPGDLNSKLMIFTLVVLLPPIFEEILFRGFLFNMLKKRVSTRVAVVLTCVLFGAAHLEFQNLNWIAAVDTLIFSGFLIYISQKHKSLYSSMLLHALKNFIAFYALFVR